MILAPAWLRKALTAAIIPGRSWQRSNRRPMSGPGSFGVDTHGPLRLGIPQATIPAAAGTGQRFTGDGIGVLGRIRRCAKLPPGHLASDVICDCALQNRPAARCWQA